MGKIQKIFGARYGREGYRFFLDGQFQDGTALEIKGPGDAENGDDQFKNYEKSAPNGKLAVASCESCDAPCKEGNKCPGE